jgi:uncharacterized membrane protein
VYGRIVCLGSSLVTLLRVILIKNIQSEASIASKEVKLASLD